MRRIIEMLEAVALVALIIALAGLIAIERTIGKGLPPLLLSAQAAAGRLSAASDALARAANAESKAAPQQTREVSKAVADAHDLLAHTDISLNGPHGLIPRISASVADQQARLDELEREANRAIADLDAAVQRAQPAIQDLASASGGISRAANDPAITQALANLASATGRADSVLRNLDAISASGNRDAAMIEKRLREALKPASLLKSALLRALGIAAPAAEIAASVR